MFGTVKFLSAGDMLFLAAPCSVYFSNKENEALLQRIETDLPGVYELRARVFRDPRGFFMETYHREKFKSLGIHDTFVQDNHSSSSKGTLRGLHYQLRHPQAKLCRVIEGEAMTWPSIFAWAHPHLASGRGSCSPRKNKI